jgi:hypothetical protein
LRFGSWYVNISFIAMNIDYTTLMQQKSENELRVYIEQSERYTPEALLAAVAELRQRNATVSKEEMDSINTVIQRKEEGKQAPAQAPLTTNAVDDTDAPQYYSVRAIYGFSIFFTVLAGALLLRSNLKKAGEGKGAVITLVSGIAYTLVVIIIMNLIPANKQSSSLTYLLNAAGAIVLDKVLWKKYLGEIKYKARPFWIPLIIWITISAVLIGLVFLGQ